MNIADDTQSAQVEEVLDYLRNPQSRSLATHRHEFRTRERGCWVLVRSFPVKTQLLALDYKEAAVATIQPGFSGPVMYTMEPHGNRDDVRKRRVFFVISLDDSITMNPNANLFPIASCKHHATTYQLFELLNFPSASAIKPPDVG